jgi:hypothetical protein
MASGHDQLFLILILTRLVAATKKYVRLSSLTWSAWKG